MPALVTVEQMRALEAQSNERGWTYQDMMEAAGRGLARWVHDLYGETTSRTVLGLVGSGNNGGDTLVALDYLARWGWEVTAYLVRPRPEDDPLLERARSRGGDILRAEADPEARLLQEALPAHEVLLDGILGTGARPRCGGWGGRPPCSSGPSASWVRCRRGATARRCARWPAERLRPARARRPQPQMRERPSRAATR